MTRLPTLAAQITDHYLRPSGELSSPDANLTRVRAARASATCFRGWLRPSSRNHPGESVRWVMSVHPGSGDAGLIRWRADDNGTVHVPNSLWPAHRRNSDEASSNSTITHRPRLQRVSTTPAAPNTERRERGEVVGAPERCRVGRPPCDRGTTSHTPAHLQCPASVVRHDVRCTCRSDSRDTRRRRVRPDGAQPVRRPRRDALPCLPHNSANRDGGLRAGQTRGGVPLWQLCGVQHVRTADSIPAQRLRGAPGRARRTGVVTPLRSAALFVAVMTGAYAALTLLNDQLIEFGIAAAICAAASVAAALIAYASR